jgi:hypothetical protein
MVRNNPNTKMPRLPWPAFALFVSVSCISTSLAFAWQPNFQHAGALVGSTLESSPIYFKGKLYLMQSRMGEFAPDGGPHSFFCVNDMLTGEIISCPNASSGFAFCSAIVDHSVPSDEVAWVFCSAWDRANSHSPGCQPWGCGACAEGKCYVAAFSSRDLTSWDGPQVAVALPPNITVPNVGVGWVSRPNNIPPLPPSLQPHQAFMVLEASPIGKSVRYVAINTGNDRNLGQNWLLYDGTEVGMGPFGANTTGEATGCPSARFDPASNYYYVMGGGKDVDVTRSTDLSVGSWSTPPPHSQHVEQGCVFGLENCAPGSDVARIAEGFFTNYWANNSDHGMRDFLTNLSDWNWSVNDVDFSDLGGVGPTYFIYGTCAQTAPSNFTGKAGNFYQLGLFNGTQGEWLGKFFE